MNIFSKLFSRSTLGQGDQELRKTQKKFNRDAIAIANTYNINLDFSNDSIQNVEVILSDLHNQFEQTKDDQGLRGIALIFAFYIISVIEKNFEGGIINRNHEVFGENSFPFVWKDSTLFPYAWCSKRIFDGPGDNVWIKYQQFILEG